MSAPGPTRAATDFEALDIAQAMTLYSGMTAEEAIDVVSAARIIVFEKYITDGPGYRGNVAIVLHPGSPDFIESFIWTNNVLGERIATATVGGMHAHMERANRETPA